MRFGVAELIKIAAVREFGREDNETSVASQKCFITNRPMKNLNCQKLAIMLSCCALEPVEDY